MGNDDRTFGEKISDSVAKFGGSWWFIILGVFLIFVWVTINLLPIFGFIKWDGYPFILLNLFLSLIAAFQAPFILMAQRRCEIKQDMIYRSLFREIKDLVEADLSLEHEIIEKNRKLEKEIKIVRKKLSILIEKIEKKGEESFSEGNIYEI
jgi:uncharacterized membrane protein